MAEFRISDEEWARIKVRMDGRIKQNKVTEIALKNQERQQSFRHSGFFKGKSNQSIGRRLWDPQQKMIQETEMSKFSEERF